VTPATNNAIAAIGDVVERVTRILSNRSIEVVQEGMKIGVEYDTEGAPKRVFLPSLSDNPSPELIVAIQGFVDKEVSALLYTDHKNRHKNRQEAQFKKGMAKALQQIIEDSRTERAMRQEFRGSASNFNKNHDFAIDEIIKPAHATEHDPKKRLANLALPAIRAACGQPAYEEFMRDKWEELGPLGASILHYATEIQDVDSTQGTFDLTKKIIRKMQEEEESECEGDGDGEGGEGGEGDPQGKGKGKAKASKGQGNEAAQGEGQEGAGSDGEDSEADLDTDHNGIQDEANKGGGRGAGGYETPKFADVDDTFDDVGFDKKIQQKIADFADKQHTKGAYIPYTRRFDYVGPYPGAKNAIKSFSSDRTANRVYDQAKNNSHVIQQQVQKLFMAKALVRKEHGLKRGRISPSALYKLRLGDPRVFHRKIPSDARNIAVSLVIDQSGSMSGSKVQYACIAALMFSQVLTNLNIPHEISTFTTYHGGGPTPDAPKYPSWQEVNNAMSSRKNDGKTYARYSPIVNFIAKGYDERLDEETKRLVSAIPSQFGGMMGGNVDGESVQLAGVRLLQRKEERKVMIVMSDGQPACDGNGHMLHQHLKDVVKQLSKAGVEMLGLGLLTTCVEQYYPKFSIVNSVEEIPKKILDLTKQMVVGA
jgi:cobaltochelatase CobT